MIVPKMGPIISLSLHISPAAQNITHYYKNCDTDVNFFLNLTKHFEYDLNHVFFNRSKTVFLLIPQQKQKHEDM